MDFIVHTDEESTSVETRDGSDGSDGSDGDAAAAAIVVRDLIAEFPYDAGLLDATPRVGLRRSTRRRAAVERYADPDIANIMGESSDEVLYTIFHSPVVGDPPADADSDPDYRHSDASTNSGSEDSEDESVASEARRVRRD